MDSSIDFQKQAFLFLDTPGVLLFKTRDLSLDVYIFRGQATLCPSGYLDNGAPTMCSTSNTDEGEQRRYSECRPDGVCVCEGIFARPEGSAVEGRHKYCTNESYILKTMVTSVLILKVLTTYGQLLATLSADPN